MPLGLMNYSLEDFAEVSEEWHCNLSKSWSKRTVPENPRWENVQVSTMRLLKLSGHSWVQHLPWGGAPWRLGSPRHLSRKLIPALPTEKQFNCKPRWQDSPLWVNPTNTGLNWEHVQFSEAVILVSLPMTNITTSLILVFTGVQIPWYPSAVSTEFFKIKCSPMIYFPSIFFGPPCEKIKPDC